jgi:hypothetical protein
MPHRPPPRHPSQYLLHRRARVEARPCPPAPRGCGQPAGETCRNLRTGEPLRWQAAHSVRLHPDSLPDWVRLAEDEQRMPDARELTSASHL